MGGLEGLQLKLLGGGAEGRANTSRQRHKQGPSQEGNPSVTPEGRTTNKQYLMKGKAAAPQKEMVNLIKTSYRWMKTFATCVCGIDRYPQSMKSSS